jgi:uncharacterized protein YciW
MLLAIPIPGTQKADDRNDVPLGAHDRLDIAKKAVIAHAKLVIRQPAEVTVNAILKLPKLGIVGGVIVPP